MSSFALTQQLSDESRISKSFYCFCHNFDDGDNEIGNTSKFVRLGCQCIIHYDCLIQYIHHKFGDRTCGISNNGINCPYMKECKSFETLDKDMSPFYNISFDDIENIITYGLSHDPELKKYLEECNLTIERINEIKLWLTSILPQPLPDPRTEFLNDLYILSTTKGCPNCGKRITHYHGHLSHAPPPPRPPQRGGCPNCHVCFCFACLSTEVENQQDRGDRSRCKCDGGYWSSFCRPITSLEDISKYISINDGGIPYDTRCGCVICSDCRFNRPCEGCPGDCCVCRGYVNPSPNECTSTLAHNTRGSKKWKALGPSLTADVNSNDDNRR